MNKQPVISIVLNAHFPWSLDIPARERSFFESVTETYLPLLEVFDRLDAEHVPFHIGLSLSPVLCGLFSNEALQRRYLAYSEARIEFGLREIDRTAALSGETAEAERKLARLYYDMAIDRRIQFIERYEGNLLKPFNYYQKKGNVELLATAATYAFLPFYADQPEAVQAQIETAAAAYRFYFGKYPQGFYLPNLGWMDGLDSFLRAYNFGYTICDTHAFILSEPPASKGSFYPVKTPSGVLVMARDFYAARSIESRGMAGFPADKVYRDNRRDAGFDLPRNTLSVFNDGNGWRSATGHCYNSRGGAPYAPEAAATKAADHARKFIADQTIRLNEASRYMDEPPLCLCAVDADSFGKNWYEGTAFLEAFFKQTLLEETSLKDASLKKVKCVSPGEYVFDQDASVFETTIPSFSSASANGYAETWLDSSNDWIYRHMERAVERMSELAERFPNESGIKERALNQAACEVLLAQDSLLAKNTSSHDYSDHNAKQIEAHLRNFTTIYESLGSSHISTEWLTKLEVSHRVFPHINYRIFRRKR